jgi:molybdenum cofactor cytidylyltransferase
MPLGDCTVLERLLHTLRDGGVKSILVVLAPGEAHLAALASQAGARAIHLQHPTPDMRSTVAFGFRWLLENEKTSASDSVLLIPADHPALAKEPLCKLLTAMDQTTQPRILIPTHGGKRGHPALLPLLLLAEIDKLPPSEGINALLRQREDITELVPVDDPAILWDLDTMEDYQKLLTRVAEREKC